MDAGGQDFRRGELSLAGVSWRTMGRPTWRRGQWQSMVDFRRKTKVDRRMCMMGNLRSGPSDPISTCKDHLEANEEVERRRTPLGPHSFASEEERAGVENETPCRNTRSRYPKTGNWSCCLRIVDLGSFILGKILPFLTNSFWLERRSRSLQVLSIS